MNDGLKDFTPKPESQSSPYQNPQETMMKGREIMAPYEGRFKDKIIAAIDKAIEDERNAVAKEAIRICEEQKGSKDGTPWNECCDYLKTEIEQQLTQ
jgi:hypothetical protein